MGEIEPGNSGASTHGDEKAGEEGNEEPESSVPPDNKGLSHLELLSAIAILHKYWPKLVNDMSLGNLSQVAPLSPSLGLQRYSLVSTLVRQLLDLLAGGRVPCSCFDEWRRRHKRLARAFCDGAQDDNSCVENLGEQVCFRKDARKNRSTLQFSPRLRYPSQSGNMC